MKQMYNNTKGNALITLLIFFILFICICAGLGASIETKKDKANDMATEEDMINQLQNVGFTKEEATEIQTIFYQIGIISISSVKEALGDGIDKLQSFIAEANNDTAMRFYFTVEKRKMFYVAYRDITLYDTAKGGILKNINDVNI